MSDNADSNRWPKLVILVLVLGTALRIANGWFRMNMIFPDEQFQTLEPANWIVTGIGWRSWEWYHGLRSWLVPGLYIPLLWLLKMGGIVGTPVSIQACRAFTALVSGLSLWTFWRLLRESRFPDMAGMIALTVFALLPAFVAWGSSTFSETWATAWLWIVMPILVRAIDDRDHWNTKAWISAGFLIGVTFMLRPQMAVWAVGLFITVLLCYRPSGRLLGAAALGYMLAVLAQGILDWITWGSFLHTLWTQYRINIVEGMAAANGTSPFWDYGSRIWENLSPPFVLMVLVATIGAVLLRTFRIRKRDWLILGPAIIYFLAHSAISHKETRFIMPMLPALLYLLAMGLSGILQRFPSSVNPLMTSLPLIGLAVLSWANIVSSRNYSSADIGDLSVKIYQDRIQRADGGDCILLVNQYLIWTRGDMVQGKPTEFIERTPDKLEPAELSRCHYAIVASGWTSSFLKKAGPGWAEVMENRGGHVLFIR